MQRGAKIALASAIVLSGWVGASLFRKPPPGPEENSPQKSDRPSLRLPMDEPGSARLSGQIEPVEEPAKPPAAVAEPTFEAEPLDSGHSRRKTMPSTWERAVASETPEPSLGPAAPAASRFQLHRIRDGDTLSSLARDYLGSSKRFMEIYEANLDRLSSPDLLPIGNELKIPPADAPPDPPPAKSIASDAIISPPLASIPPGSIRRSPGPAAPSTVRTYRVRAGDTLATIARHFYGDGERYLEIYEANREQLKKPSDLCEGVLLTIP
ncbi:MAG TPA: LysM peptidoglycan-binding domain-containing protein [Pirellulales bacterium]|nr:LysM peptidoglycan-binding domain-containing protein [Pirellulales bacterium]